MLIDLLIPSVVPCLLLAYMRSYSSCVLFGFSVVVTCVCVVVIQVVNTNVVESNLSHSSN